MNFWRQDPKTLLIHISRNKRSVLCGRALDSSFNKISFLTAGPLARHFCLKCARAYADPLIYYKVEDANADIARS